MQVSTKQLMQIFNITSKSTPTQWRKQGASVAYLKRDTWDLGAFIQWWAENVFYPTSNKEISDSRERWEKARAEKLEIEVEKIKGGLYAKEVVDCALNDLIQVTKKAFQLIPDHAISMMVGMGPEDQRGVLQELTHEILIGLSESATVAEIEKRILAEKKK